MSTINTILGFLRLGKALKNSGTMSMESIVFAKTAIPVHVAAEVRYTDFENVNSHISQSIETITVNTNGILWVARFKATVLLRNHSLIAAPICLPLEGLTGSGRGAGSGAG